MAKCEWRNVLQINGAFTWMTQCGRAITIYDTQPAKKCECGLRVRECKTWLMQPKEQEFGAH